jgi:hypothetical protein
MSAVIERRDDLPVTSSAVMSPATILQLAVDNNFDLDRVSKLMEISEQWRKIQAERAFNVAIAAFKENPPEVIKDAKNSQYKSTYSTIGNLVNTVNPALGKHGLSTSWDIDQSSGIKVTCILEHIDGHKKTVSMTGPLDTSGAKNPLQQLKSTLTYLKVATFEAVTGVVASNDDDDGNSSGGEQSPAAPNDYEDWKADMTALADEGIARLEAGWKKSAADLRKHATTHDGQWWAKTKTKAQAVRS